MILFHGSHDNFDRMIRPNVSFDYEPLVYATDDLWYALIRCGNFNIDEALIKEDYQGKNTPFTLTEIEEGAFEKVFDTDGYIYIADFTNFFLGHGEFVSREEVKIQGKIYIPNIWRAINDVHNIQHYKLTRYEDADWSSVCGGKEGYLKQRMERIKKIKETQYND